MGKIIWAPSALDDIEAIARYIERDSIDQAALFVTRIIEMTDHLEGFPESGRIIPEINKKDCREIIYGAYRIMYRIVKNEIWIVGVVHAARNWHPEKSKDA
ncbi:MAG TPA: type II toxin-antitoxin system RelE/ParE family toxin [Candidatus Omnitrophota bacterium]|nr:type II toxin-antitoxin system RelE/ParE family toxin [Candidatus Omnitrophota bacterium]